MNGYEVINSGERENEVGENLERRVEEETLIELTKKIEDYLTENKIAWEQKIQIFSFLIFRLRNQIPNNEQKEDIVRDLRKSFKMLIFILEASDDLISEDDIESAINKLKESSNWKTGLKSDEDLQREYVSLIGGIDYFKLTEPISSRI